MKLLGRKPYLLFFLVAVMGQTDAQQATDQAFWDRFDQARLHIAKHNAARSINILEELRTLDSLNPNVNYLFGVSLVIVGKDAKRAARLLELAHARFDQLWDNPGVGPPEHLFYYLIVAHCRNGDCDLAKLNLQKLEDIYANHTGFLTDDEYYLIDGRKWASLCKEPTLDLLEVSERLIPQDLVVKTRTHSYSTLSTLYGVQVAALLEPQMTRKFERLKNVEAYVDMHGVYRYVIGNFSFRSQAEKLLEIVRSEGYADAFVVNITDENRYPLEVLTLDQRSPKAQLRGDVSFRVQLAAFKESLPEESARFYLMVDSISEMNLDDMTLLLVGNFKSYGDAILRRNELRMMGFKDAFIVAFNEGRKIPIDDARQHLKRPLE